MKWVIWHLPYGAQRVIAWATGYRVTRFMVGGRVVAYLWRRWPR